MVDLFGRPVGPPSTPHGLRVTLRTTIGQVTLPRLQYKQLLVMLYHHLLEPTRPKKRATVPENTSLKGEVWGVLM